MVDMKGFVSFDPEACGVTEKVYFPLLQELLEQIQGTPEELIRFVDQVLRDHVRGAGLRLSQAGPGTAPLLEPDHCAGPVSK